MPTRGRKNSLEVLLPYGSRPLRVQGPPGSSICDFRPATPAPELRAALQAALAAPIGAPPWAEVARAAREVTIIVSDATRDEPRDAMLESLFASGALTHARVTLAVANGTHGPGDLGALGIDRFLEGADAIVNHDAHDPSDLVVVGVSRRGTPLRVHRCAVDADLVVMTGWIKPHYFAGFGAGAKAIFPGLGGNREVRQNHLLKTAPGSIAGRVDGNPCRDDLEEVLDHLPSQTFLLNAVGRPDHLAQAAVAGEPRQAFRRGAEIARPLFRVAAPLSRSVVVSDDGAVNRTLYQASKMVAAAAPLLLPGARLVIAAECADGIGGLDVVNRAIWDIGLKPRIPEDAEITLVSSLPAEVVAASYCVPGTSVEATIGQEATVFLPHASTALIDADSSESGGST